MKCNADHKSFLRILKSGTDQGSADEDRSHLEGVYTELSHQKQRVKKLQKLVKEQNNLLSEIVRHLKSGKQAHEGAAPSLLQLSIEPESDGISNSEGGLED